MIQIRKISTPLHWELRWAPLETLCRVVVALALLLILAFAAPARAQCLEGWLPGQGFPGTSNFVNTFAVLQSGDVIVGGDFTTAGGVTANYIARYSPTTRVWSALGSGMNGRVLALAVLPGGDVIVGGFFTTAGVVANRIARYSPTTGAWSALGSGANESIRALVVLPDGDVIAGGYFTTAGGVAARNIARYHPTTSTAGVWSALGSGLSGGTSTTALALAVLPGGDVIVGGRFTTAGGVAANRIARYNTTTGVWTALGSGIGVGTSYVNTFEVLPGGDVIVGGSFATVGSMIANSIARYNPTTGIWSTLGAGTDYFVSALAVLPGGEVLVGGNFSTAGGSASAYFARYTFGSPAPTITSQPSPQTSCLSGGAAFGVAGSGLGPFAHQWRKDTVFLDTIANPSASTAMLAISNVGPIDVATYDCVVTNPCGSVTSNAATLTVCAADFSCDGTVDFFDYLDFVAAFASNSQYADFNRDGMIDFFDYLDFVAAFSTGC